MSRARPSKRGRRERAAATERQGAARLATKRRVLVALVVALGLWPLLHIGVVRVFDLNPWNWYGWAMYTQPNGHVEATARSFAGEQFTGAGLPAARRDEVQRAFFAWSVRRLTVDPPPPDAFARALLAAQPGWEGVEIEVRRIGLERSSATVQVLHRATYRYPRDGASSSAVGRSPKRVAARAPSSRHM